MLRLLVACLAVLPDIALAEDQWRIIAPVGQGFSFELPGTPDKLVKDVPLTDRKVLHQVSYKLKAETEQFAVTVLDFPPGIIGTTEDDIDRAMNEILSFTIPGRSATQRSRKTILLAGQSRRETVMDLDQDMSLRNQMLIIGDRVYYLGVMTARARETGLASERFIASFKLLDPAPR
ncbi:MAG: hypothetical protein ACKVP4_04960 [Hyphomicrobium sp.]